MYSNRVAAHCPISIPQSSPLRNSRENAIAWLREVFDLTAASSSDNLRAVHLRGDTAPKTEGNEQLDEIIQAVKTVSLERMHELHLLIEDFLKPFELEASRMSESF